MKRIKVLPTVSTKTINYDSRYKRSTNHGNRLAPSRGHSLLENSTFDQSNDEASSVSDENVSRLWQDFRSETTMHGLKHASQIRKHKLRGTIWSITVTAMMFTLMYYTYDLFKKYSDYATISNIKIESVDELQLPAITFCNLSPYKLSSFTDPRMRDYFLQMSSLEQFVPQMNFSLPQYSDFNDPIEEGWLQNKSFSVSELFPVCVSSNYIQVSCKDFLRPTVTEMGICYTANSFDYVQKYGVQTTSVTGSSWAMTMFIRVNQSDYVYNSYLAAGMKIVLHDHEEEPDVSNKGFFVSPGYTSYASMHLEKHKYQPYPYKSGGQGYCLDTKASGFTNPLRYHKTYSRSACLRECKLNFIYSKCGCRSPTDYGNSTICSLAQLDLCYQEYNKNKFMQACSCPQPCEYNVYSTTVTTALFPAKIYHDILTNIGFKDLRENYLEVRLFFDTLSYLKVEHIPEYTLGQIVASLGGQMGIFLGASLLTIAELIEVIILSCILFCRKMSNYKKQKHDDKNTIKF